MFKLRRSPGNVCDTRDDIDRRVQECTEEGVKSLQRLLVSPEWNGKIGYLVGE